MSGIYRVTTIQLAGPICECEQQDLGWRVPMDKAGNPQLTVHCCSCGAQVLVPNSQFRASIVLDVGYPKGRKPSPQKEPEPAPGPPKVLN